MEGLLLVPPERNSFLGRSLWKTRFVVLGPLPPSPRAAPPRSSSSGRLHPSLKHLKLSSRNVSLVSVDQTGPETVWLSLYKQKGDREPLSRYPVTSIDSCVVEDFSYRKTTSAQPTLTITFEHEDQTSSRNSRRASQSSITSSSKIRPSKLLFRNAPDASWTIFDWRNGVQKALSQPPDESSHFDASFSFSDRSSRPSTSTTRPALPQSQSSYVSTTSSHHGSTILSPSHSIRSSHTAFSSHTSISPNNPHQTFEGHSSPLTDTFPPASTHRPDSNSSPSAPRESILDRAFKMNYIPAPSPTITESVEIDYSPPMSSIARFEAIMRDIETRKTSPSISSSASPPPSLNDTSPTEIPLNAQRALDFISQGQPHRPPPLVPQTSASQNTTSRPRKRHTGPPPRSRPTSLALPPSSRTSMADTIASVSADPPSRRRSSVSITPASSALNSKHSTRLSFTDFTRRLSETASSGLLVPKTTPAPNGGSSNGSNRSSGASEGSFRCSGEDEGGGGGWGGFGGPQWGSPWGGSPGTAGVQMNPWAEKGRSMTGTTTTGSGCNRMSGGAFGF